MRISDWSSDVCSSDLPGGVNGVGLVGRNGAAGRGKVGEAVGEAQPVGKGPLLARLDRPLGHPEQADVVVALGIAGDLDELRHTFAPAVARLDPGARSALVVKVEIDVAAAVAVALHETENARVPVADANGRARRPVGRWPHDPLTPAGGPQPSRG